MIKKTDLGKCKKLIDSGFSLITVGDDKVPNFPWKKYQTEIVKKDEFDKNYNYNGGIFKKNGDEIKPTKGIGLVTGFNGIEVIDIDLKVFPSLKEQQDFWNEYTGFLADNIDDFDKKFVIYKTLNNGYHIIYRCATIGGNVKVAKLKNHTEAIIETRGVGGYVFIYENQVSKKSYYEIEEISELDRSVLFDCSKFYNYVEESKSEDIIPVEVKKKNIDNNVELPSWEDYNNKESVLDILGNDFKVIKRLSDKYIIKREGATSAHSGYIYKDSGCMYLFSTGTIYPNETLLSPFAVYTFKHHGGNFSLAAKDIYSKGYGSRIIPKVKEIEEKVIISKDSLVFPIDIFPNGIQNYLKLCNETLDSSLDYMGCSMMWLMSIIIGNSIKVQVKNGWLETATLWMSVVGKAGIGKTPSISNVVFPIMKANNREKKKFIKESEKYSAYKELDKKDRQNTEEIKKPKKTQFIANDITLEALVDMHEESKNAVGVFKDELAGWFKDMNKYRAGSDLEFWLSSWSGKSVSLDRKTAKSSFVEFPLIPVLGGIQPGVLDSFYTEENKDNGFIDRMLLCFPDLIVDEYNESEIDDKVLQWYSSYIISFYDMVKNQLIKYDSEDEINSVVARFSPEAKKEWVRIFNNITKDQNSDEENEYMKSMLPKQKSYIPRFALILNSLTAFDLKDGHSFGVITKESMLGAEKLSKYFISMAKKIKINTADIKDLKKVIKANGDKTNKEKFLEMYRLNPELNKSDAAEMLGISRKQIYKYLKESVT